MWDLGCGMGDGGFMCKEGKVMKKKIAHFAAGMNPDS